MTDEENPGEKLRQQMLNRFETGNESGPIEDRTEREHRLNQLPTGEKELAHEIARVADLCQHMAEAKMDIPADILDRIAEVWKFGPEQRLRELASINQDLMEYLNRAGSGSQRRQ